VVSIVVNKSRGIDRENDFEVFEYISTIAGSIQALINLSTRRETKTTSTKIDVHTMRLASE
jgi:hypothetical protein